MERGTLYGIEGLDGTGKTTVAKQLALDTNLEYLYFLDNNRLKAFRTHFDKAPVPSRFLYYLLAAIECDKQVDGRLQYGNIILDRTIYSTIAYHKALGLNSAFIKLIPRKMLDRYSKILYLTADNTTRQARITNRRLDSKANKSDDVSFVFDRSIDREYRLAAKNKLLEFQTSNMSVSEVVNEIRIKLNI